MMHFPHLLFCLAVCVHLVSIPNSSAQITIVSKAAEGWVLSSTENSAGLDIELKPGNPHAMLVVGLSYTTVRGGEKVHFKGKVIGPDGLALALKETVITPNFWKDGLGMGRLYTVSLEEPGNYRVQFTLENHKLTRIALLGIILANVDPQSAATAYSDPAADNNVGSNLTIAAEENDKILAFLARSGVGKPLECNGWEPLLFVQASEKVQLNGAIMLLPVEATGEQTVSWSWRAPYSRSASCAVVLRPAS